MSRKAVAEKLRDKIAERNNSTPDFILNTNISMNSNLLLFSNILENICNCELNKSTKFLLLYLYCVKNENNEVYAYQHELSQTLGTSIITIKRDFKELIDKGFLVKERNYRNSNKYTIHASILNKLDERKDNYFKNISNSGLTATAKLVLLYLKRQGRTDIPIAQIAKELGVGLTATKAAIKDLVNKGFISKTKCKVQGNYNEYNVINS